MSALSMSSPTPLFSSPIPPYHQQLSRVRYMPEEPLMKVLLAKDQEGIMVEVKGPHNVYDPYTGKKMEAAFMGSSYYMLPTNDGIQWGQEFPGIFQVVIVPDQPSSGVYVNGVAYPGAVAFYEVNNRLAAVNWVGIDDFTTSLMSANFQPKETEQKEALAAYAIALRTKAYQQIQSNENAFWDITAESCGYRGNVAIRKDAPFKEAMRATKKIIMTGADGTPVLSGVLDKKAIETLKNQMPLADVQAMAKEGRDARIILHKYFPNENLFVVEQGELPVSAR